jgi:nucleoside-diphosphate-sugar epimerase
MDVLLTGGSGDLGAVLARHLTARKDTAVRFDVRPPRDPHGTYVPGSILDRDALVKAVHGVACIVHIAAWHGIHEHNRSKDAYDFWELNVRGTFEVCEAAARAGVGRLVLISSTSVSRPESVYGHSKVLSEQVAAGYGARHGMGIVVLRPRAFIPHWNRDVYGSFAEWARWFARGGVHIDDVTAAVLLAIDRTSGSAAVPPPAFTLDGAYEYTDDDLAHWDADGPGSMFRKYYPVDYDLAVAHGIDPCRKPRVLDRADTASAAALGYRPGYSMRSLLAELRTFGAAGPPAPA